jgi:hypothetical protein
MEVSLLFKDRLHGQTVALFVALEACGLDGRSLGGVEKAEVNRGPVGDPTHLTAQGIDLLDELAFSETADRGIAGHQGKGVEIDIEQKRLATHPRRCQRRLAARMAAPDNDNVIFSAHPQTSCSCCDNLI